MKISSLISIARISIFMVIVSITLSSCYVNRHTVGNGPVGKESGRIYSRGKQVYLFGGLWAVLDSAPTVPPQGDYQFKCSTNLVDIFL